MAPSPLDRVLDYANAQGLSVRWGKYAPGQWEVRLDTPGMATCGYGEGLQEAASNLLSEALGDVDAEAGKLSA